MKRKLFLFLGALSSFAYSSQKKVNESSIVDASITTHNSKPVNNSTFFDPSGLVSPGAQGTLDTLGKGFSFMEGPSVGKHRNVFFTDQPNDRIYR